MKEIIAMRGARVIVETCASIKGKEKVLIVADFETENSAQTIAKVAYALGAEVTMGIMSPREMDGYEPTESIAAAMVNADVILTMVSKSLAHTKATERALAEGARLLSLTAISEELIASEAFEADFKKQRPICEKVAQLFTEAKEVRISTPAGTNLRVSAEGRKGNAHSCIVDSRGQFSAAPNIEASFSPVEGTMEGVIVADGSIPYFGIGLLSAPITFTVQKGRVVGVEGGRQAEKVRDLWEEQRDPNVYNIAQVSVGLNPRIKAVIGRLGCNYDEGAFGTVHIGIGTSANIGGEVRAPIHFDVLMNKPTMELDGKTLLKDGELMV